ncbi:MAG TPA: MAPEG family protein [Allosphingosinicella sp.]|jgi:hypothetical protein
MTREQKIVSGGAAGGVLAMLAGLWGLSMWMLGLPLNADGGERVAYASGWIAVAAAPLFFSITAVTASRFSGAAIDPTLGVESRDMKIDGRVVDNTVQQYLLFIAASLGVAAGASGSEVRVVGAAALVFVTMRFAFWIGYRFNPLYRAFGMAGTSYLNVSLFCYAAWLAWW